MKDKHFKMIKRIGNVSMLGALGVAATALVRTWYLSRDLPAGACPLIDQRPWFFTALSLCLVSLICMIIEWKAPKPKP